MADTNGRMVNGRYEPPTKKYNIYFDDVRVWSGDDWPAHGIIDAVSRCCAHANATCGSHKHHCDVRNADNVSLSY